MAPPLVKILTKVDTYLDTREDFDKCRCNRSVPTIHAKSTIAVSSSNSSRVSCVRFRSNSFEKSMNPSSLPEQCAGQTDLSSLGW